MVMDPIEVADIRRLVVARLAADPIRMMVKHEGGDAMAAAETLVIMIRIAVAIIAEEIVLVGTTTPGGIATLPMVAKSSNAERESTPKKNSSQSVHRFHP